VHGAQHVRSLIGAADPIEPGTPVPRPPATELIQRAEAIPVRRLRPTRRLLLAAGAISVVAGATAVLYARRASIMDIIAPPGQPLPTGDAASYRVGNDTVFVIPYSGSAMGYADVPAMVSAMPLIVLGTVLATTDIAAEVVPSPDREGVVPGEGADLFGTITFAVTSVVKGRFDGGELRVAYESGKRDARDRDVRLAYRYQGLAAFQLENGTLRPATEFTGRTFMIFAQPNDGTYPIQGGVYRLAHPYGIAQVRDGSPLAFGDGTFSPVIRADGASVPVSLDDIRAALR
jgi:hypothetical protein